MPKPIGYTRTQISLHWVVFVLIVSQYAFHDNMVAAWENVEKGVQASLSLLVASHVFGGLLILVLTIWRLRIKVKRGAPELPENEPKMQKILAHASHGLLYLMLILVPLSGATAWFGGVVFAAKVHDALRILLLLLIFLHFLGGLYHWIVLKSGVMQRMFRTQ